MKLLLLIGLIAVCGWFYPGLNEDVSSNCQAVESKMMSYAGIPMPRLLTGLSQGEIGKALAKEEFSELPPQVGCFVIYWNILIKKDQYKKTIRSLVNS